jgi:hypothetical protein
MFPKRKNNSQDGNSHVFPIRRQVEEIPYHGRP